MAFCPETQVEEELMLDFTESIRIETPPARVWAALLDIERWWPAPNPEHESIDRLHGPEQVRDGGDPVEHPDSLRRRLR